MKILWRIQITAIVLCIIALGCVSFQMQYYFVIVLMSGLAILLGINCCQIQKQKKIMELLISDNKRNQSQKIKWSKKDEQELDLLRKRVELSTLQMQINPHFLYNTLDTIRGQALMNDQKDIAVMTEKLAKFFRYCISNRENMVHIQEETNHILDYYYIQKQRFGDRFEMNLCVEDDSIYDYYVPKLILQPLVENAIAHGIEKVKRSGKVTIDIFSTEEKIIIKVSDNGIGISEENLAILNERLRMQQIKIPSSKGKNNGIAAMNVNARIRLIFGDIYGIHYRSVENAGTEVVVTLPKINEFLRVKYENLITMEQE